MYKLLILKETGQLCLIRDWEYTKNYINFTVIREDGNKNKKAEHHHYCDEKDFKRRYEIPMTMPILLNDTIPGDLYMYDLRYSNTTEPILYRILMLGNTTISLHDVEYDIRNLEHEVIDPYDSPQGVPLLVIDAWSINGDYISFDEFDKVYGTITPAASIGNSSIDNATINNLSFNFKSNNSTIE